MKGYIVTLMHLPQSVEVAKRCINSALKYGVEAEMFPAVFKDTAHHELMIEGLKLATFEQSYSNVGAVIGNFVTQYRIWKTIYESGAPGIVLEHDAVFVAPIPVLDGHIINLGKPSYGRFNTKDKPGIYPMFSKSPVANIGTYIPGAHGYYVTPCGARQLLDKAKELGASPCDIFLNTVNFPDIKEAYPWPIEAHDSFSTIQFEKGCKAKHNYNKSYQLL